MNVKRILALADTIEELPDFHSTGIGLPNVTGQDSFRMDRFRHECGAPACMAGWAIYLWGEEDGDRGLIPTPYLIRAGRILGLMTDDRPWRLFEPHDSPCIQRDHDAHWSADPTSPAYISNKRAAAQLRHLAKTGEVDWSATPYED